MRERRGDREAERGERDKEMGGWRGGMGRGDEWRNVRMSVLRNGGREGGVKGHREGDGDGGGRGREMDM